MADIDGLRSGRHCFALHANLVFVTKFRHRVFGDRHLARMEEIMRAVCADFETELVEFNGDNNHVHLLVNFPPKPAPAKLVNGLKGVSSRRMRQEFPDLVRHYYQANKTLVGLILRRLGRRGTTERHASIHRAANRPVQRTTRTLAALPAQAFTPDLKDRTLAATR